MPKPLEIFNPLPSERISGIEIVEKDRKSKPVAIIDKSKLIGEE